ncbi:hypothetical protein GCM10010308_15530 [Streptomyces vinaceusdrappus]|nr:hypothetical protein GCM10010308_15530 [Streptomyces vinaceusdrappus]
MFGVELYPHAAREAAALLHSMARNHALIDGNKPTAWLAMRVFLRFNGVCAGAVPPSVSVGGPFVEEVAQDTIDVPAMAKSLATWFPDWETEDTDQPGERAGREGRCRCGGGPHGLR